MRGRGGVLGLVGAGVSGWGGVMRGRGRGWGRGWGRGVVGVVVAVAVVVGGVGLVPGVAFAEGGSSSLALGVAGGAGAVDPQTGGLSFSVGVGVLPGVGSAGVSVGLEYEQSSVVDAGLGPGLSWGLPQVVSGGSVFVSGGKSFPVDVDAVGGLSGYLLRDAVFVVHEPALPAGSGGCLAVRACAFTQSFVDGRVDGFDASGLLAGSWDRDGNLASYVWDGAGRLVSVSGGFPSQPQTVSWEYSGSDGVRVVFPDRVGGVAAVVSLVLEQGRLVSVTDAAGRQTSFSWSEQVYDGVGSWLLSQWDTSSGARVAVTYQAYDPGVWAVASLSTVDVHTGVVLAPPVTVSLDPVGNSGGRNFTGYPDHVGPPPAGSGTTDALVASNDRSFRYSTSVSDGVTETVRTYNWLHQLVGLRNTPVGGGSAVLSTVLSYPAPAADWPAVSPDYQVPVGTSTTVTDPVSGATRTVVTAADYDDLGRQVSQTVGGVRTDTVYDTGQTEPVGAGVVRGFGQVLSVTATVVSGADAGQVQSQAVALTVDRKHPARVVAQATDPRGGGVAQTSESVTGWDAAGQVVSSTVTANGAGGATQTQSQSVAYSVSDGLRVVQVTDPAGGVSRSLVDPASGLAGQVTGPDGVRVDTVYDGGGRVVQVTAPTGSVSYAYTQAGFDGSGTNAMVVTRSADGYAVRSVMDPVGRVVSRSDNQVGGVVSAAGWRALSATGFDERGNVVSRTDQVGLVTTYEYDPKFGQVSRVSGPDGSYATFGYDAAAGTVTTAQHATDGSLVSTSTVTTDEQGRTLQTQDVFADASPGSTTTAAYTGFGKVASAADTMSGMTTSYGYNASGAVVSTEASADGQQQASGVYTPTPLNALASSQVQIPGSGDAGSATSVYDTIGLRTSQTDPTGQTQSYGYDAAARPTTMTEPDGSIRHVSYDPITGKPTQSWWTTAAAPDTVVDSRSSAYDPITGSLQAVWYTADQAATKISYGYDPDGRLTSVVYPDGGKISYSYADNGQLTQMSDPVGTTTQYRYDPDTGRLLSAAQLGATASYEYDTRGNLATVTRSLAGGRHRHDQLHPRRRVPGDLDHVHRSRWHRPGIPRLHLERPRMARVGYRLAG